MISPKNLKLSPSERKLLCSRSEVLGRRSSIVLVGDDVIGFAGKACVVFVHAAILTKTGGAGLDLGSKRDRDPLRAHAACKWIRAWALAWVMTWSSSAISSISASSSGVSVVSWLRRSSSQARSTTAAEGRKATISLGFGPRARNPRNSRRRPDACALCCRKPRLRISARCSRSGPTCLANSSGISMVNCTSAILRRRTRPVKPDAGSHRTGLSSFGVFQFRP